MSILHTLRFIVEHPLNQKQKVQAVVRFLRWQLASRAAEDKLVVPWIESARLMLKAKDWGLTGNIYCGLQEYPDMAYALHTLEPSSLFVDIGANAGSYTVLACAVRGARGICFEPLPATYAHLLDNIRLNDLTERVRAYNIGIGEAPGELEFSNDENTKNHVLRPSERKSQTNTTKVEVLPLDEVLRDEEPSLLKIDVEGFETSVIRGAQQTLRKDSLHSIVMELGGAGELYGFDEQELLRDMYALGFRAFDYDPMKRRLLSLKGDNPSRESSHNTILIKDVAQVEKLLRRTPKVDVNGILL